MAGAILLRCNRSRRPASGLGPQSGRNFPGAAPLCVSGSSSVDFAHRLAGCMVGYEIYSQDARRQELCFALKYRKVTKQFNQAQKNRKLTRIAF